ncbi:hypothetical protein BDV32DRAFT_144866 [Aspergillus pseudonomiae]|uniref:Rhodopsin domain-containing protein n=1 Tax=Aspergillus pseudonomiae TaxID=1506151 RepID=A0A5N6IDL1_9EURO|nr:uncharacterized protein BDV37DRAFT_290789 [Aspergillus pseudonomiae]KAB8264831.1 hypothetical protein BDV32DRAFT_144866 [Aspergillus pseudonomiae]KAE8407513.1 hypothetical protein BDV37DRAFT_290789 [Aspergillus pseudonomiae]
MAQFEPASWNPAVAVITWLLMSITILAVISRLVTKWLMVGGLTTDDAFIVISLAFSIGNNITIAMATAHGFGNHTDAIIASMQDIVMKSQLAGSLLFILSLLCSKLAMIVFIRSLTPASRDRALARVSQGLVIVTAVTAFFGTALQCHLPRTWDYLNGQCIDRVAWVVFLAITNGATDIVIVVQAMVLIVHVQTTGRKKLVFASIFIPRLLVVASSIAEIILTEAGAPSTDPFINAAPRTICMEITQSLSIITACWGQLKPFLVRLRSNAFCLHNNQWSSTTYSGGVRAPQTSSTSKGALSEPGGEFALSPMYGTKTKISTSRASAEWESQSQSSETYIIRETRTWTVDSPTVSRTPIAVSGSGGIKK